MKGALILLLLLATTNAYAQTSGENPYPSHVPLDKKELDIWKHEQVMGRTDAIRDEIIHADESQLALRSAQCDVVFPHKGFCDCLNDFLPIRMSMIDYMKFALGMNFIGKDPKGNPQYTFDKALGYDAVEEKTAWAAYMTCAITLKSSSQVLKPAK